MTIAISKFQSVREFERADFRRLPSNWRRYGHGRRQHRAYLYLVVGEGRYAKVGKTVNPLGRIPMILNSFEAIDFIYVIGPAIGCGETEVALRRTFARHTINDSCEWFELSQLFYASLQHCFSVGCTDEAVFQLHQIVNAPEPDYQI